MNKERLIERIKDVFIVLLFISMIVLGWKSGVFAKVAETVPVFGAISGWFDGGAGKDGDTSGGDGISVEAARPLAIVVTDANGGHFAEKYDREELDKLYERTGRIFKEALGSAGEPTEITERTWRTALGLPGICFEYIKPVQLSILDGWLGTDITGLWRQMGARRICVYTDGGEVYLMFADDATGVYYKTGTNVSYDVVTSQLAGFAPNGALYAFEEKRLKDPEDPYLLLMAGEQTHPVITASNPLTYSDAFDAVLAVFGVSREFSSSYSEKDGTLVFVENDSAIRISTDGTLVYRLTENAGGGKHDIASAVETVRQIAVRTVGAYSGDAQVDFLSAAIGSDGAYSVEFYYSIAGGRVFAGESGCAACATVTDGVITELELMFRTYSAGPGTVELMSEVQTAAASGGEDFILGYSDSGASEIQPEWFFG